MPNNKKTQQEIDSLPWGKIARLAAKTSIRNAFDVLVKPLRVISRSAFTKLCAEREIFSPYNTKAQRQATINRNRSIKLASIPYSKTDDCIILVAGKFKIPHSVTGHALNRTKAAVQARLSRLKNHEMDDLRGAFGQKINIIPASRHPMLERRYAYY